MEFQNTIAYLQTYNAGGVQVATTGYTSIDYGSTLVEGLAKNIDTNSSVQKITIKQTGSYFVDFSLIASKGDGKTYTIAPFVNDVQIAQATQMQFYQQPTEMDYEVSFNQIFNLNADDTLEFKFKVGSVSATSFYTKDIKIMAYNINQLGIH